MKAIITIPEKDFQKKFNSFSLDMFRRVGEKPSTDISPMITEKYPIGEPITVFTGNMPPDLQEKVKEVIAEYCGI